MILIDTAPFVALCDARDPLHQQAVAHLAKLHRGALATCEAVLAETCFHLPHVAQRHRLRALVDELGVEVTAMPDGSYLGEVFDWLTKYAEHEPDWADGWLAVMSGRERKARVWTYDREFRTTWRRPDGSRIPMAVP